MIAYTKNKDLYVFDLTVNKETRLTFDASDKIYNGYCSWVYMEEILERPSPFAAFRWSPEGYKDGSAFTFGKNYKCKLYVTHGDMDDNVHMQNSICLISRLEDEGKVFEFMLYPEGRHGWAGVKATHSKNEANNFWLRNFFGK